MIKGKYQNQGCKSFIIILLLLSSSKCCLPINEQQAKLITTYFEQTYVLNFKIKKFIRARINGSLVKLWWRFLKSNRNVHISSNFTKWLNVFIYISRMRLFSDNLKVLYDSLDSQEQFKILFSFLRPEIRKLWSLKIF